MGLQKTISLDKKFEYKFKEVNLERNDNKWESLFDVNICTELDALSILNKIIDDDDTKSDDTKYVYEEYCLIELNGREHFQFTRWFLKKMY